MFYLMMHSTHLVEGHTDNEIGNQLLPLHGADFLINSKGYFICSPPTDRIRICIMAFPTPAVEQEVTQWFHHEGLIPILEHLKTDIYF